jgi:hypothetical protein
MPLVQRVCKSILSGGLGELGPQNGGSGGHPPGCCGAAQQRNSPPSAVCLRRFPPKSLPADSGELPEIPDFFRKVGDLGW